MDGIKFWHRVKLPDGTYTPGMCKHGPDGGDWPTTRFGLPEGLAGQSVLDIGAWDGFFSFEAEKRGAEYVLATNPLPPAGPSWEGFDYIHKTLNSKVEKDTLNIEWPWLLDQYDIVLFFGVLYHLKSPLIAMENVYRATKPDGMCLLETAMAMGANSSTPILEYHPLHGNDPTNYFYPNDAWIMAAAKQVGFKKCEQLFNKWNRATYRLTK